MDSMNILTNDHEQEQLTCAGCVYLDEDCAPCANCIRSRKYADYYRQAPEKGLIRIPKSL